MSSTSDVDLDPRGRAAWRDLATSYVREAITQFGSQATGALRTTVGRSGARANVQWTAFPERVGACLGRKRALELLDARPGLPGGRDLQEEYIEWRVVRHGSQIERIEFTTELPDYWAILAAHSPSRLLKLVRKFADTTEVAVTDVFDDKGALGAGVSPDERKEAFRASMLEAGRSPFNDGRKAICCMRQQSNSLFGAAALAAASLIPRLVADATDGHLRPPRCDEAVPLFWAGAAQLGRASDPLLVERLGLLAAEGRAVAFDLPIGVYIQSVAVQRLRTPDGAIVTSDWLRFSRGSTGPDGRSRFQRLTFEAPPRSDYCVSDLIDVATEQRIRFGGEIADLVSVALFFRVSAAGALAAPRLPITGHAALDTGNCRELRKTIAAYERAVSQR